jgi:hypothetical protein
MIPMNPLIPAPRMCTADKLPRVIGHTTLANLCETAKVRPYVSGGEVRSIVCVAGSGHFLIGRDYFVGVGDSWKSNRTAALRVLEVLAHGFHDYAARECVCRKKLFSLPKRQGRPPAGPRAKTARERMAAMRARRAA